MKQVPKITNGRQGKVDMSLFLKIQVQTPFSFRLLCDSVRIKFKSSPTSASQIF